MKFTPEVLAALQTLKDNAENDFERHRINVLEKDLTAPPVVEIIDDSHQKFNGMIFHQTASRHASHSLSLHRAIYSYYHGEIPEDYEIHHIDENKDNNDISNLQLLTKSEHRRLHNLTRPLLKCQCVNCGKIFDNKDARNRLYCSPACYIEYYRKTHPDKRICEWCGKEFTVSQDQKDIQCCSHSCAAYLWHSKKTSDRPAKYCEWCGKELPKDRHYSERRFCSNSCASYYRWSKKKTTQKE